MDEGRDIRIRAIDGAFWNTALALINKGVTLVGQLLLARLLMPKDVGAANLAIAVAAFAAVFSVGGIGDVLLQRGKFEEEAGDAFWLSLIATILMGLAIGILAFCSPLLGRPEIKGMLVVLAIGTVFSFPTTVFSAEFKHRLHFGGWARVQLFTGIFFTVSAVFLAWAGFGAYALVIPSAFQFFVAALLFWWGGARFKVSMPRWGTFKELLKPSFAVTMAAFFLSLQFQAPLLVCSLKLNSADLGFFSWGWMVAGQAVFLLAINLSEILMPIFLQADKGGERRAEIALKTARTITALLCVACGAQALLADPVIRLLLPAKWLPAVPVIILASFGLIAQGLSIVGVAWLKSCGRYRLLLVLAALQTVFATVFTWLGLEWGGMIGATMGCGIGNLMGSFLCVCPMGRKVLFGCGRSWIIPLGATYVLGFAFLEFSYTHLDREIFLSAVFIASTLWLWWREDDGGLASVTARILQIAGKLKGA